MDLYACGFNAHRQLGSNGAPSKDRLRLQRICGGSDTIRVLFAGWADTLCKLETTPRISCKVGGGAIALFRHDSLLFSHDDYTPIRWELSMTGSLAKLTRRCQ